MRVALVGRWPSTLVEPLLGELRVRGVRLLPPKLDRAAPQADLIFASEFAHPASLPSDRPMVLQCWHGTAVRQWELTAALPGGAWARLRRLWQLGLAEHGRGLRQRLAESAWVARAADPSAALTWLAPSRYAAAELLALGLPSETVRLVPMSWDVAGHGPASRPGGPGSRRRAVRQRLGWLDSLVAVLVSLSVLEPLAEAERERLPSLAATLRAELARWPRPTAMRLVIVGDDPFAKAAPTARTDWLRRAARLGLGDWLDWAPPSAEPSDLLAAGDVLLSLAGHDPVGAWAVGALAWQMPSVLSRFCGAADWLDEGRSGFVLAQPTDLAEVADRLLRLAESSKRFRFRTGLADVAAELSPSRWAEEVLAAFSDAVRGTVRQRSRLTALEG